MFSIKRKQTILLGIDISSTSIKLIELSKTGDQYKVEAQAVEPLPADAVVEKNIQDAEAVSEAIKKALKRSNAKSKFAAVAVAGSAVITKSIQMPAALSDKELEEQIQLEADQYIPYPLDEINLDFQVIGPSEKSPDMNDILLAASRSENVEIRTAAVEMAGLTTKVVDVEAYTIETSVPLVVEKIPEITSDSIIAVIDVGATMTSLNVIINDTLVYTREQAFGGKQLTEEIMRRYALSYEEAGRLKKEGGLPDNYIPEVLEPFKETMAQQVSRFLQFFYTAGHHDNVDIIILAGGCASIAGIDEHIEEQLGVKTIIANPFSNMALSNKINPTTLSNDAPSMMIACGLALRSFDDGSN